MGPTLTRTGCSCINDATNVIAADFEVDDPATGANDPISGVTPITNNVWHHAAATYDGTTWKPYTSTGTLRLPSSSEPLLPVQTRSSGPDWARC